MKRPIIIFLFLILFISTSVADSVSFYIPEQITAAMNEILPHVIQALGVNDTDVIRSASDFLSVSYTETEENVIYYNNEDWSVELSFYYSSGQTGTHRQADAVNFILSKKLSDAQIKAVLYSLALSASYGNSAVDQHDLMLYLAERSEDYGEYETAIGCFSLIPDDNTYHFVLYPKSSSKKNVSSSFSDNQVLLSGRKVQVDLRQIRPLVSKSYPAALELHVHITNQTNQKLNLTLDSVSVDGIALNGTAIYNIYPGSATDDYFILKADSSVAMKSIGKAREAVFTITAKEVSTGRKIAENTVSLDLSGVPSFTPYPTASPKKTLTSRATATPRTPARATIKPTSTPSRLNQIRSLSFSDSLWAEWEFKSDDKLSLRFEMTASKGKSVRSFELYIYAADSRGRRIYGTNQIYHATTEKTIRSGQTDFSDYIIIPKQSQIAFVYCGIKQVTLSDGTIETVPDSQIEYFEWTID